MFTQYLVQLLLLEVLQQKLALLLPGLEGVKRCTPGDAFGAPINELGILWGWSQSDFFNTLSQRDPNSGSIGGPYRDQ